MKKGSLRLFKQRKETTISKETLTSVVGGNSHPADMDLEHQNSIWCRMANTTIG